MRAALVALDAGCLPDFSRSAFHAYWGELRDVSQPEELAQICTGVGLDPNDVAEKINSDDIKGRLRTNTEELVARGGFGSPTMFINGSDMYFGNDRLPLGGSGTDPRRAGRKLEPMSQNDIPPARANRRFACRALLFFWPR